MNNKQLGNAFEIEFCKTAAENGFWVHRLQDNKNGQPADVILSKNGTAALIDCKVCDKGYFLLSRMEENQISAMTKWMNTGNKYALFVLKIENEVRVIDFSYLMLIRSTGVKRLTRDEILSGCFSFRDWVELVHGGIFNEINN